MIKVESKGNGHVDIVFVLPADSDAIGVAGEFNDWNPEATKFRRRTNGTRSAKIALPANASYQFLYVSSDGQWYGDDEAPDQVPNPYGSTNSVVTT